jgi:serine phosphatase RsbU (regulator of sigma subunit)
MIGSSLLHQILQENPGIKPSGMLQLLDKGINFLLKQNETETKDGMDIALCVYDPNSGTLEFSGAMRPMFLIRKEEKEELIFHEFKADKESIGGHVANDSKNFENHVIRLEKGDTIYFATDGFTDQFGGVRGKKLMTKKFKDLLQATVSDSMTDQEKKILRFWDEWSNGYEQVDDVLVLGLRIDEPYGS